MRYKNKNALFTCWTHSLYSYWWIESTYLWATVVNTNELLQNIPSPSFCESNLNNSIGLNTQCTWRMNEWMTIGKLNSIQQTVINGTDGKWNHSFIEHIKYGHRILWNWIEQICILLARILFKTKWWKQIIFLFLRHQE